MSLRDEPEPREHMRIWNAVHPHYVEEFGPEAATIGPPDAIK